MASFEDTFNNLGVRLETYYPSEDEVPPDRVVAVRALLENKAKHICPELATAPNTPFGDLFLTPAAFALTAAEIAMARFASDLNLANVASGLIYNCKFVEKYLDNFSVTAAQMTPHIAAVRLKLSSPAEFELDKSVLFALSDSVRAELFAPAEGPLYVLPYTSPAPGPVNIARIYPEGVNSFIADIFIQSAAPSEAEAGSDVGISKKIPNLISAKLLYPFPPGSTPNSLSERAKFAGSYHYALSPAGRESLRASVLSLTKSVMRASPVFPGDQEMTRDISGGLGARAIAVDLRVSGTSRYFDTRVEKLSYSGGYFQGQIHPPNGAAFIVSARPTGWTGPDPVYKIISYSAKYPMASALNGGAETLWFRAPRPSSSYPISIDMPSGAEYGLWEITYLVDPSVAVARALLTSPDYASPAIDLQVLPMHHIWIKKFEPAYIRKKGTLVDLPGAAEEIKTYLHSLGHPELFSAAKIAEIMFYAGAEDYRGASCDAELKWGVATHCWPGYEAPPNEHWEEVYNNALVLPKIEILSDAAMNVFYKSPASGGSSALYAAAGPRTICYRLAENAVAFRETT